MNSWTVLTLCLRADEDVFARMPDCRVLSELISVTKRKSLMTIQAYFWEGLANANI